MTNLIAFTGYKQTGKTTAANYLVERYGYMRHNFKDALVAEIKERFPDLLQELVDQLNRGEKEYNKDECWSVDTLFTHKPPLIRALMQNYGTEVRRADDDYYWVNEWLKRIPDGNPVVIDDVRFRNESKAVTNAGGTIIRLTRPDITTGGDHQSETEQNRIEADYAIEVGPGEHDKLYAELDRIVST